MSVDPWIPKGLPLPGGDKTAALSYHGEGWRIFRTENGGGVLLARPDLAERWRAGRLIEDDALADFNFGQAYQMLRSGPDLGLWPLAERPFSGRLEEALAVARALAATRKISAASLADGLFVERLGLILPTGDGPSDDRLVLGTWLSRGVAVSTDNFDRLARLTDWLPPDLLTAIIKEAGFPAPETRPQSAAAVRPAGPKSPIRLDRPRSALKKTRPETPLPACPFHLAGRRKLSDFLNEQVIDIVRRPEDYQALGIDFPTALLLHGPPGSGKTFAVKKLAEYLGWPVHQVDSSSVASPFVHETGRLIATVFDRAEAEAPALIVIDEVEAFLSHRESQGDSRQYHLEEVAEFLRRIPEASARRVLVIGMTNLIDLVDKAMLRRGRFDHVFELGLLDGPEAMELLAALTSGLPHEENLDLAPLATAITGRPLSDAAFVIREAARLSARSGLKRLAQSGVNEALAGFLGTAAVIRDGGSNKPIH